VKHGDLRTMHGIGIEVYGGRCIVMIPAGSRTPVARGMTFTTVSDGQRAVEVRVVRCTSGAAGERGAVTDGRHAGVVGRFLVPGLGTGRRGEARIDIGISLDGDGTLRAWGADRSSGARQDATFPGMWALPPQARPRALAALARRVHGDLAGPEFEDSPGLREECRLVADLTGTGVGGAALAALAGEIESMKRSTASRPVSC
jgi:hypothetical protein